jgi:hypothetical protein
LASVQETLDAGSVSFPFACHLPCCRPFGNYYKKKEHTPTVHYKTYHYYVTIVLPCSCLLMLSMLSMTWVDRGNAQIRGAACCCLHHHLVSLACGVISEARIFNQGYSTKAREDQNGRRVGCIHWGLGRAHLARQMRVLEILPSR